MSIFSLFKHPPHKKLIEDPEEVKKQYKHWRIRIFYSMYIGYVFFYVTRKSFTFAMPLMMTELGLSKAELGMLGGLLYITYGISKFVSGVMSDRSNPRYFMGVGLILTGIFNVFFGFSSSMFFLAVFWGLNGWFQGWGWPPCARLLTHWYSQNERGSWWSIWSTSHSLGGAAIPMLIIGLAALGFGWRAAMYFSGIVSIVMGFFLINRLRDTPQSLGLPCIEHYREESKDTTAKGLKELSSKEILFDHVLKNPAIWLLGFAYFFVYIIRIAVNDWGQLYLLEHKGLTLAASGICIVSFEIGGFLGTLAAGWISDKVWNGRRGPVNLIFCLVVGMAIASLWFIPAGGYIMGFITMFMIGFFVFGPQMLIGVAAAELSHKKASGTATGFVGWFAYVGAAVALIPLGKLVQDQGWDTFVISLAICAALSILLLSPLWYSKGQSTKTA